MTREFLLALFAMISQARAAASSADLRRARRQIPGAHLVGEGHVGMAKKLNAVLRAMPGSNVKACEVYSVEELIDMQRKIHQSRDPALEAIYRKAGDKGRSMRVFGTHAQDIEELEVLWADELETLRQFPWLADVSRDMKCHEVVMWMVHHVPESRQAELRKTLTLPLLPERELNKADAVPTEVALKFPPGGLGCDAAHAQQTKAKNTEFVEWPEEVIYTATGHGAFPFWDNGGPGCSHCDPSISGSAQVKTMYSGKLQSEILMHESCGDMTWTGSSSAPHKSPCNHIFTPDDGAFIYTPKTSLEAEADGKFCCRSVNKGSTSFTGAVPRDWMKTASYEGTYENFQGDHYNGTIKMFTWNAAGLAFWYYTKPDGSPVQQGESCQNPAGKKPVACQKMMPITLYHDWSSFKSATFTQADFNVPEICKSTSVSCTIPGATSEIIV